MQLHRKMTCYGYIYAIRSTLSILKAICPYWVNPFGSDWIDNKAAQLRIASQLEFQVPETLISNNPTEIRDFFTARKKEEVIYKPFSPMTWQSEKEIRRGETTLLSSQDLLDDQTLSICPGIFQTYIPKAYEVRVTAIGKKIFAIALYSQEKQNTIDWRLPLYATEFPTKIISLPKKIYRKISAFMKRCNLLFGCFDFIVTKEEKWVFLEINPMGQFLWIEELHPELFLLETFCHLLTHNTRSLMNSRTISFIKFRDEIWEKRKDELTTHVTPEKFFLSLESN